MKILIILLLTKIILTGTEEESTTNRISIYPDGRIKIGSQEPGTFDCSGGKNCLKITYGNKKDLTNYYDVENIEKQDMISIITSIKSRNKKVEIVLKKNGKEIKLDLKELQSKLEGDVNKFFDTLIDTNAVSGDQKGVVNDQIPNTNHPINGDLI